MYIESFLVYQATSAAAAAAKSLQSCPTLRPHRRQPTSQLLFEGGRIHASSLENLRLKKKKQSQGERGLWEWLCLRLGQCISPEQGMCPRWSGTALLRKRIWPLMILPTGSFSSVSKHAPKCLILKKFPRGPRGGHTNCGKPDRERQISI